MVAAVNWGLQAMLPRVLQSRVLSKQPLVHASWVTANKLLCIYLQSVIPEVFWSGQTFVNLTCCLFALQLFDLCIVLTGKLKR